VLVCDNLPSNGETVARIVGRYAALRDPALAEWIANEIAFPCTMVDRIVPATTAADRAVVARLGYETRPDRCVGHLIPTCDDARLRAPPTPMAASPAAQLWHQFTLVP
jgi:hypothetical protein